MSQCGCGSRIACMSGLLERRFPVLRRLPCCMVGMRKSLRIRGSSDEEEHSGAFWFPAFLLCVLLSKASAELATFSLGIFGLIAS